MSIVICSNCKKEIDTDYEGITCICDAELCMDCQEEECPLCGENLDDVLGR